MIPIAFITDNNYFMPTMVAIQSLIDKKEDSDPQIYILGINLCLANERFLNNYQNNESNIIYHPVAFSLYEDFITKEGQYVSIAALVKFQLAELFPEFDKLLYLDSDIIIRHSLQPLYDTDLENNYAAVVKDLMAIKQKDNERLGLNTYFNSGVLLLNCKKIREEHLFEKLLKEKRNNTALHYMDQDVFNVIFNNNVKFINVINNYQTYYGNLNIVNINMHFERSYASQKSLDKEIIVLHLAGRCKPWNSKSVNYYEEWLQYYKKLNRDESELKDKPYEITNYFFTKRYVGDKDTFVLIKKKKVLKRHIENGTALYTFLGLFKIRLKYIL